MTYQDHFTLPTELLEQVAEQGLDFLPELILCDQQSHASRTPEVSRSWSV
jgi:hypothetical protein